MNEIKVWSTDTWSCGTQVRFNAGEAIDLSDNHNALAGVLYFDGNLEELLKNTSSVYRYNLDYLRRFFYFSEEDALNAAREARPEWVDENGSCVQKCYIEPAQYKPVALPVCTVLETNAKGLYCRLNLRPDVFGTHTPGKIYFPDHSCKDKLCAGPVVITEVKERTSYGFVKGYPRQFQAPTDEQLSNYIIESNLYDFNFRFCTNRFGSFVFCPATDTCFVLKDGNVHKTYPLNEYDPDITVREEVKGVDLVCQGYQGCNFDELVSKFGAFQFVDPFASTSSRYLSDLFDEAVSFGFISLRSSHGVEYVEVHANVLKTAIDQFSREEMQELFSLCADLNEKANKAIQAKIRSGKIRLNTNIFLRR